MPKHGHFLVNRHHQEKVRIKFPNGSRLVVSQDPSCGRTSFQYKMSGIQESQEHEEVS